MYIPQQEGGHLHAQYLLGLFKIKVHTVNPFRELYLFLNTTQYASFYDNLITTRWDVIVSVFFTVWDLTSVIANPSGAALFIWFLAWQTAMKTIAYIEQPSDYKRNRLVWQARVEINP